MKNINLILLVVGAGLMYLITKKKKKNTVMDVEESIVTKAPITESPITNSELSLSDLQDKTAEIALEAYDRKGFPLDEKAKEITSGFFKKINNKKDLYDYQTLYSKKIDGFTDKLSAVEGQVNMDDFKKDYNDLGLNISFDRFKKLTKDIELYMMEKIMGSMSDSSSMNGWDY